MSLAQALSTYFSTNVLILIGFSGLACFSLVVRRVGLIVGARSELKLHYGMLLTILSLTLIHPFLPKNKIFSPAAKVWSAQSIQSFGQDYTASDKGGYLTLPTPLGESTLYADQVTFMFLFMVVILFVIGGGFILKDISALFFD